MTAGGGREEGGGRFVARTVSVTAGVGGGGDAAQLAVIDLNDGSYSPRIFDLFFLFTGGVDGGAHPSTAVLDADLIRDLFRCYLAGGGARLSTEEVFLLSNAMQLKAAAMAAYFARWSPDSNAHKLCTAALVWMEVLGESRHVLRQVLDPKAWA